jgi:hypothetical protein
VQELFRRYIPAAGRYSHYEYAALKDLAAGTMVAHPNHHFDGIRAAYVQAYHIVKEVFYSNVRTQHLGSRQRQFDYRGALSSWESYNTTYETVDNALNIQRSESWAARLEIRMPYSKFLASFDMLKEDVRLLAEEGGWLYVLPSKLLADVSRIRICCCDEVIKRWRALPLRQRCDPQRLTLALLCTYIMNLTLGPSPFKSSLGDYDLYRRAGNLFFIEEADWISLKVTALDDDIISRILGPDLAKKFKDGRQSNLDQARVPQRVPASALTTGIAAISTRMFTDSFTDIWQILPKPRQPDGRTYLAANLDVEHLGAVTFCLWPCNQVLPAIKEIRITEETKWREKFDILFPTAARIIEVANGSWGQGWKKIAGREDYLRWVASKDDEEVEELRGYLWEKFKGLLWIPNFMKGSHVWRTRGGVVEVAHRVYVSQH